MKFLPILFLTSLTFLSAENPCTEHEELCSRIDWSKKEVIEKFKNSHFDTETSCKKLIEPYTVNSKNYDDIPEIMKGFCKVIHDELKKNAEDFFKKPENPTGDENSSTEKPSTTKTATKFTSSTTNDKNKKHSNTT